MNHRQGKVEKISPCAGIINERLLVFFFSSLKSPENRIVPLHLSPEVLPDTQSNIAVHSQRGQPGTGIPLQIHGCFGELGLQPASHPALILGLLGLLQGEERLEPKVP